LTADGGFIFTGTSSSGADGNKTSASFGVRDLWIVRVDADGDKVLEAAYGGTGTENALAFSSTIDGGMIVGGNSSSDVSGLKTTPNYGDPDFWVLKLLLELPSLRAPRQTELEIQQSGFHLFMSGPSNRLASASPCDYRNHTMKTTELTVTRVGNSRGVRLPAAVLRRYQVGDALIMELRPDEIVLRPKRARGQKLSWAETYQQMAQTDEDWSAWESLPEGLAAMPGEVGE